VANVRWQWTVGVVTAGLWTSGTLKEAESGYVRFENAGTFTYHCEEHPWAMGQVFVDP
jgi:plastocyanin